MGSNIAAGLEDVTDAINRVAREFPNNKYMDRDIQAKEAIAETLERIAAALEEVASPLESLAKCDVPDVNPISGLMHGVHYLCESVHTLHQEVSYLTSMIEKKSPPKKGPRS